MCTVVVAGGCTERLGGALAGGSVLGGTDAAGAASA